MSTKTKRHSRERARKRGEGDIYGVIDELIAPAFVTWIAAWRDQPETDAGDTTGETEKGQK
jgi:hypothetical protein